MIRAVVIAALLGVAGLVVSFWLLGEDWHTALTVPAWSYLAGLGLAALNYVSGAVRLMLLARRASEALRFVPALRAYALGLFSAAITPGSAGQAPAVALSLVAGGMSAAHAWTVNVRVWVLDLVFIAWSLPLSILVLGRSTQLLSGARPGLVAAVAFVVAALLAALFLFRLRWLTNAAAFVTRLPGIRRWRPRLRSFLDRFDESNANLRPASLPLHAALHLLTFVIYTTTYFTFFVVVDAMRPGASPLVAMASAQVPSVASAFFPTPGGTGLLEVGTASLMRLTEPSATRRAAPVASNEPLERSEGFGGNAGTAGVVAGTDDAKKAQAGVAAAIVAWRLLTFYLRMVVGPLLGGNLFARRKD